MIKRTIEISTRGLFLSVRDGQLLIRGGEQTLQSVPVEDIGVLLLATPAVTLTGAVVARLLASGAVIVPCGDDHLPAGLLLPQHNALQTQRMATQVAASRPLKKRLWRQIVVAKVACQRHMLPTADPVRSALAHLARRVRSGDPENIEAQAARRYWTALLGKDFRRRTDGDPDGGPNDLLNYGYTALRAAVARAVCGAGLHPSLGLCHANRSDSFALADDLMEPLRPLVDRRVKALTDSGVARVNPDSKRALLEVLTETVACPAGTGPLMVALERYVASLVRCYGAQAKALEIPRPCN